MSLSSLGLDAFYACAKEGHFTRAAEKLHITQSALSQRIQHLEEDLQTALFVRQKNAVRLTAAGERLLKYCLVRDALESEAVTGLNTGEKSGALSGGKPALSGHVRIGGFSSVMRSVIMPALEKFLNENPLVRLQMMTRETSDLPLMLKRGEIDFMILDYEFSKEGVLGERLGIERNVLCEAKGYKGAEIYLDHDENDEVTLRYLKMIGKSSTFERHYLDDVYGLIDGVRRGLGRAVLPRHLIMGEKGIRITNRKELEIPVWLHYYEQPFYSRLQLTISEAIKRETKKNLA